MCSAPAVFFLSEFMKWLLEDGLTFQEKGIPMPRAQRGHSMWPPDFDQTDTPPQCLLLAWGTILKSLPRETHLQPPAPPQPQGRPPALSMAAIVLGQLNPKVAASSFGTLLAQSGGGLHSADQQVYTILASNGHRAGEAATASKEGEEGKKAAPRYMGDGHQEGGTGHGAKAASAPERGCHECWQQTAHTTVRACSRSYTPMHCAPSQPPSPCALLSSLSWWREAWPARREPLWIYVARLCTVILGSSAPRGGVMGRIQSWLAPKQVPLCWERAFHFIPGRLTSIP